ncbi:hypothetical protein Agub_g13402, partial [Astrephomene gubernaculifera]
VIKPPRFKRPRMEGSHDARPGSSSRREEDTTGVGPMHCTSQTYGSACGEHWPRDLVQMLVGCVTSLPPGGRVLPREAIALLGWAELPDPDGRIYRKVKDRLQSIRNQLAKGVDPLAGRVRPGRVPLGTYKWRVWLRGAFLKLPNHEATVDDLAAILESDPDISPRLDKRPDSALVTVPRWRRNLSHIILTIPGVTNTGQKRGRLVIYHYDEEAARQLGERGKPPKVPKHRVPQMGVHNT